MTSVPKGIPPGNLRIAIVMLNSPNISMYAHHATMNNYMYASKHGYDFIVERQPQNTTDLWSWNPEHEYVLVWYKAEFIKRHLKNYHYVLFIDSDAYFVNYDLRIETALLKYFGEDKGEENKDSPCMIFQEDVWRSDFPSGTPVKTDSICAGLIFVKNCPESFRILDTWINSPYIDPDCQKYINQHAREQDAIIILKNKYPQFQKWIYVLPANRGIFGQYDSKWIVHLGGIPKDIRTRMIKGVFEDNLKKFEKST